MVDGHIKKLEALKEKKRALQEMEDEIRQELTKEVTNFLVDVDAFDHIEFDIIMGGIIDVIEKAKNNSSQAEAWKSSGQKFRQQRGKRKATKAPPKTKKTS